MFYIDKYLPFGFLALSIITGGDLLGDIMGIAAGHCYYYLKDVVPINFRKDVLITPRFVERYFDKGSVERVRATVHNTGNQNTNNTNSTNNNRGSFSAFSGRGTTFN